MLNSQHVANGLNCQKEADMKNQNQKLTILYSRLSVEDERDKESNSITTQRTILENYAKQHNLTPYIHIIEMESPSVRQ